MAKHQSSKKIEKSGFVVAETATAYGYSIPPASAAPEKSRDLGELYGLTLSDFAEVLEVTPKTLSRWKQKGETLSLQKSDRLAVLESIFALGEKVLGSSELLQKWLRNPVLYLKGQKPIDLIKTETGRGKVKEALCQIQFGMY